MRPFQKGSFLPIPRTKWVQWSVKILSPPVTLFVTGLVLDRVTGFVSSVPDQLPLSYPPKRTEMTKNNSDRSLHSYAEKLVTFDAIAAARNPDVQKELLKMAKSDKNPNALKHARNVISRARKPRPSGRR